MGHAWKLLSRVTVLASCSILAVLANAGNIRGNWDPDFGGSFTGTGFLGEVVFFVPDLCLTGAPSTTVRIFDADGCSSGGMSLVSANVSLYDFPDTSLILSTIAFAPPVQSPDPVQAIVVEYSPLGVGKVIGLDTDLIGPEFSGVSPPTAPDVLYLQFSSGWGDNPPPGAYLLAATCSDGLSGCEEDINIDPSNPGEVTYTPAPEPGSLALLLGALGAGWVVRRRTASA